MFVAVFGDSHPDVAATYQNLAVLYQSQGNQAQTTEMATSAALASDLGARDYSIETLQEVDRRSAQTVGKRAVW